MTAKTWRPPGAQPPPHARPPRDRDPTPRLAATPGAFTGSGPGEQAPDGCSVDFYRALPYLGELADVLPALAPGTHVLELGCGAGRLTRPLLAHGLRVTAVDNSAGMLAALPPQAAAVHADIETLALGRTFDAVLLASTLVNHPGAGVRAAFLAAARRHLHTGGLLFLQRHDPAWLRGVRAGDVIAAPAGLVTTVESAAVDGALHAIALRYDLGGRTWRQAFVTELLDDDAFARVLADAGFGAPRWLDARRRWAAAPLAAAATTGARRRR
jgi:SAM-dependent methyltransferase